MTFVVQDAGRMTAPNPSPTEGTKEAQHEPSKH